MADIKITELSELEKASLNDNDVLPIVDISEDETKKIKVSSIKTDSLNEYSTSQVQPYSANYTNANFTLKGEVLYNNTSGTGSNIQLEKDPTTYERIEIYWGDTTHRLFVAVVYPSENANYSCAWSIVGASYGSICETRGTVTSTGITISARRDYDMASGNIGTNNDAKIYKVIGYK